MDMGWATPTRFFTPARLVVPPWARSSFAYLTISWQSVSTLNCYSCTNHRCHFIKMALFSKFVGNHELYDIAIAQNMHNNFAPQSVFMPNNLSEIYKQHSQWRLNKQICLNFSWKGSYLSSNVNITTSGTSVPIGSRYCQFTTEQGRTVTAFGIIFHFTGNANGTIFQPPAQVLCHSSWFVSIITSTLTRASM
jgi:hypothetical protein